MKAWLRGSVVSLLALGASLTGCGSASEDPESIQSEGDLKKEDTGDWEPKPLAWCKVLTGETATAECGTLESFDLSACDAESFDAVDAQGVFTLHNVGDDIAENDNASYLSAFRVLPDGSTFVNGIRYTESRFDSRTFYFSRSRTLPNGQVSRTAFVGCKARGPHRVTGCYASCVGGVPAYQDTFEAEKVVRLPGEGESSGLPLVGEGTVSHGIAADVYVTHGHAYVAGIYQGPMGPGGLHVFDLSDRTAPRLVKSIVLGGDSYWNAVWARGNALYVASLVRGVLVFDISDPANPVFQRNFPGGPSLNVHTLYGDGDRLYAMSPGPTPQTLIFDVTNPLEPVLLHRHQDPSVDPTVASYPHDATAQGNRLYVNHWRAGLLILDVSDPLNIVKLGEYKYPYATSHTNRVGVFDGRTIAFEGGEDWGAHLRVLDITDPTQVTLIGEYRLTPGVSIHNMELKGDRLYLAHYQHGVRVLDVSKPKNPKEVAYYNTWRETDRQRGIIFHDGAIGIRIPGDGYVYVTDTSRGLLIFPEL
ncbi:hypothetical protein HPC49_35755 [Pyxidicoccus fallax]|uniref:Lipoprotein n=1 Tax=Pyxidicoccus fallax TaxID=394095 RepID=A0A848LV45_9BACT|nr:hypothetical protein [Pyxidicoccus fallax]NMO21333.1 hypothetical protein [Pyxidicoccus fallax]NPC83566.1 hypothetical protein [Pyxidicoccus fallax]